MAGTPNATLAQISALLKEGKVQEADDLAKQQLAATPEGQAAAAAAAAAAAEPRDYDTIIHELLGAIVAHLGNHPQLTKLLEELKAVVTIDNGKD